MKILVVYYSRTGNSRKVAQAISNAFKCDIEEIVDSKNRKGIIGWLMAGRDSTLGLFTKNRDITKPLDDYDMVIVGGPIWAFTISVPVSTFLNDHGDKIKNAAFFCTEGSVGHENAFKKMASILGKDPAATLVVSEKELKNESYKGKISDFADQIRTKA